MRRGFTFLGRGDNMTERILKELEQIDYDLDLEIYAKTVFKEGEDEETE